MKPEKNIPELVKQVVLEINPRAEVYLFGSRARGDFKQESDWDFLILTSTPVTAELKERIRNPLFDIDLNHLQTIQTIFGEKKTWEDYELSFLYQNIKADVFKV